MKGAYPIGYPYRHTTQTSLCFIIGYLHGLGVWLFDFQHIMAGVDELTFFINIVLFVSLIGELLKSSSRLNFPDDGGTLRWAW